MSKHGFLNASAPYDRRSVAQRTLRKFGVNEPPPARPNRKEQIVLFGEKARSIGELLRKAQGKYPVYCQTHYSGVPGSIEKLKDEESMRIFCTFRLASKWFWENHGYVIIRRA